MILFEPDHYKEAFIRRGESAENYARWLDESQSILEAHHKGADGNIDRAAEALAAHKWDAEALGYLAYSGFCFWHLPINHLIDDTGNDGPHWAANKALKNLLDKQGVLESKKVLDQVNHRLDLAAIAFLARGKKATKYVQFQKELLQAVMIRLAHDDKLAKISEKWPHISDENGKLASSVVEVILTQNPRAIAEKVSNIIVEEAKRISPSAFEDLPNVEPNIYVGSNTPEHPPSGTYRYDWYCAKMAGYNFDCEIACSFANAPRFIGCNLHEVLHILQNHWTRKDLFKPESLSRNLFFCEVLVLANSMNPPTLPRNLIPREVLAIVDNLRSSNFDKPRLTYSFQSSNPAARSAKRAYVSRPSELYAHLFGAAVEHYLCEAWGVPERRNFDELDIPSLTRTAENIRISSPLKDFRGYKVFKRTMGLGTT